MIKSSVSLGELGWFLKYATTSTFLLFAASFHLFLCYINDATATVVLRNSLCLSEIYRVFKKNGAVSKVNNKFISHLTLAHPTPSAAETTSFPCATSSSLLMFTAGGEYETWTVSTADGVRCAGMRWEINLLLTFETAPFFCEYPVLERLNGILSTDCLVLRYNVF
jgi:hypothetical protein